jgi:hypothetical protein
LGGVTNNLSIAQSGLGLREIVETVVEVPPNAKQHCITVYILTKIHVVNLVEVALVHVTSKNRLRNVVRCGNLEEVEYSQELRLGDMAALSDVKVLETRF